jgi:hypothetical protein
MITYTFVFTNGRWKCWITLPNANVTVPAGATTGTVVPTTVDTIDEVRRLYYCSGTASATGTINDNDGLQLATITPASATEGSAVFEFSLSNLLLRYTYTFVFTNGTAGSADYTLLLHKTCTWLHYGTVECTYNC